MPEMGKSKEEYIAELENLLQEERKPTITRARRRDQEKNCSRRSTSFHGHWKNSNRQRKPSKNFPL